MTPPTIVLAAGGTGGHMFPAEALARALIGRGLKVALVTDRRGQAFGAALPEVPVHRIRAGRLSRHTIDRLKAALDMGFGAFEAKRLLRDIRPAAVVGFGGYPSIPTILAASWRKVPVLLHDQNALLGRANRRMASRAQAIATSFETVSGLPDQARVVLTGNPVRPGVIAMRDSPYSPPAADGKFTILVTGGSQGARVFSDVVPAAAALLPPAVKARLRIVQQSRPEDIDAARAAFAAAGVDAELSTFFDDVPRRLASCQLAITRSGASTVAELGVVGRPSILVPYPFATDDHQTTNAEAYTRNGAGWVVAQRAFTPALLAARIETLLASPAALIAAAAAARRAGRPEAADKLAQFVLTEIGAQEIHDTRLNGAAA